MMSQAKQIKPLSFGRSIVYGLIPGVILFILHYYLIPGYIEQSGEPYFNGYWVGYLVSMGLVFVAAFIAYRREGNRFTWTAMKERFRLKPMTKQDWFWTLAIIFLVLITYFGLSFTGKWVKSVPLLSPRNVWPLEWGPQGPVKVVPGEFMGLALQGQWWVVLVYALGVFFNIIGEEFLFRGYFLPRQELAYGKHAWIVNSLMFWVLHIYQPWILIATLPTILFQVYIVQVRKNTWISIIQHGFVNSVPIFFLIAGVVGF
jgi:membrane protease YdiL (CAAX protease family)